MRRLSTLLLLVLLLAACTGSPSPTPTDATATPAADAGGTPQPADGPTDEPGGENGKTTISFAAFDYERQTYEPLIKKFKEENPNIDVVLVPLDDLMNVPGNPPDADYSPQAQLRRIVSGADTAPAIIVQPETIGSDLLLDLAPLMDADSSFKRDDFFPGALEQYTAKGGTRVLPRYVYAQMLTYNKELFKNAGLPEPKPGWTWTDLLGAAEQLAKKNGSKVDTYGYFDISGGFLPLFSMLKDQGIDLLNTPSAEVKLDRPEVVSTVTQFRKLIDSGAIFRPEFKEAGPSIDPNQLINDGHVGIWASEFSSGGPAVDGPPSATPSFPFATGQVPYPSLPFSIFGGGVDGFIISSGTTHPNESWKWIEFLSRQITDDVALKGGPRGFSPPGRVPARQSLADQSGFWKNLDPQAAEAYKWAIAHPAPPPERTPDYMVFGALSQALDQVLGTDKKDPQKALQEAQKQLEQQVAEVQLTPTPKPSTGPVVVATPEPQAAPEGATTIHFSANGYNPPDLRRLARAFRDQHPEIFVDISSTEVFTDTPTAALLGQKNDCFALYTPPQTDADFKALLDLQPLFDADASFPISDYPATLLGPYQHGGGLYGLPYAATMRTLNYNKTAFEAAGIKPPTEKWKPDDFLAAAQALTKGDGDKKQFGYVPLGGAQQDMFFFLSQFGGQLITGSGKDIRPNFTDPKVVQGLQWYLDLSSVHKVMPPLKFPYSRDDANFEDHSYEYVQNGRAGLWFDQGYGMFGGPNSGGIGIKGGGPGGPGGAGANFEIGLAPLPVGASGLHSGDFYLRGLHISAQTQQAAACWEWLKFLSADITSLQGSIPARSSIMTSDEFAKQAAPDMLALAKVYADVLKQQPQQSGPSADPNTIYQMDTYWFYKALSEALDKKTPLDQGLADAQKFTTAWLDCMGKSPNKPATCATQVDPNYKGFNTEDPPAGPIPVDAVPRG
jgi:ABC-type glycerol-3-phosphate transport system substrate-binding protein